MLPWLETHESDEDDEFYPVRLAQTISCLLSWRKTKQIFTFDPKLVQVLRKQEIEGDLPVDVIKTLPYQSFFIQTDSFDNIDGVFVYFDDNGYADGDLELRFMILNDTETASLPLHLIKGKTLRECIDVTAGEKLGYLSGSEESLQNVYDSMNTLLQMVLYLCSDNKDVVEKKRLDFTPKSNVKKKKKNAKKTAAKKPTEWNVGTVISRTFNKSTYAPQESTLGTGIGSSKRPHVRKAHWHHYWKGSRSNPEERKLILHWVAPTFINKPEAETPTTINRVK